MGPPVSAGVAVAAGGVPRLATHGIECLGGPADDVKRVGAADGVGASLADHVSDPFGPVRADMGDLGTPAFTGCLQRIEEGAHGRAFAAGMSPHQPAGVVVDHDGQVLVVAFVGDLIDPDPPQAGQRVDAGGGVGPHPRDDDSDCAPSDPHQLGDCSLGALGGQPGHLLVETAGVSRAVSGPGDLSHRRPVDGAVDPRGVSFNEDLDGSHIQPTPPPPPLTTVIPGGPRSADSASTPARSSRPHMGHENLCRVVELDVLDHRVLDPQHGAPYAGVLHAVLRSVVVDLRQAKNLDGERRVAVEAHSATHRYGTRATIDDDFRKHVPLGSTVGAVGMLRSERHGHGIDDFIEPISIEYTLMPTSDWRTSAWHDLRGVKLYTAELCGDSRGWKLDDPWA